MWIFFLTFLQYHSLVKIKSSLRVLYYLSSRLMAGQECRLCPPCLYYKVSVPPRVPTPLTPAGEDLRPQGTSTCKTALEGSFKDRSEFNMPIKARDGGILQTE